MPKLYLVRWYVLGVLLMGTLFAGASANEAPPVSQQLPVAKNSSEALRNAVTLEGSDTEQSLSLAREALRLSRQQPGHPDEMAALLQIAKDLRLLNDYAGAASAVNEGIALAAATANERMRGEFLLVLGTAEWNQARLSEATGHLVETLRIAEKIDDKLLQFGAHARLGLVRGRYDDLTGELAHLQTALQLANEIKDPVCTATVLNSLGNHYMNSREYALARTHFEQALDIMRDRADQRMIAFLFVNLGQIATETGDQVQARRYLNDAMSICQHCHNQRGIADAHYLLAAVDRRSGRIDDSLGHLREALGIAEAIKNPDLLASVYEEYVRTEEARNAYPAAAEYARKLEEQRQLMRNEASQRRAAEVQARYEQEAHARKILLLQRDKDLQDAALSLTQSELIRTRTQYTIVAFVLVVLVALLVGRMRFNVISSRRNLAESRAAKERAEHELRESEARFRSAFDYSALGLALVARDGRWLRVNRALCDILGYTASELLATNFQAITHPDDLEADLALVEQLLRGEIPSYHLEKRYFHKEGHIVWIWLDVSLVRDESGQPRYFISQIQDITGRKRAAEALQAAKEEAERANNAKSEFLSRTSHELRTPLNAILGFGQLLEIEDLTARQMQSVDHVMTAGRHLLGLIDDVLDMAKIENGRMALAVEPVCLAGAAREAFDLVRPLAGQISVLLRPLPGEEGTRVAADPRRLRQILLNLLSNAIKFNRPFGEVTLGWQATPDGKRIRIEVADTGIGMAPEDCERIFSPFTRLPASEQVEGTGLGLPLSRALAEGMGGTLGVRSVPGQGSVFHVGIGGGGGSFRRFARIVFRWG